MSNKDYTYSFSYTIPPLDKNKPKASDLYAFGIHREYQLPGERTLLYDPLSGKSAVVSNEVLYALRFCNIFRTLDAHIEELIRRIPALAEDINDARRVLSTLIEKGILISARTVLEKLTARDRQPTETAVRTIFCISTCDRPDSLARLLESLRSNWRSPKDIPFYVIDDSRLPRNQQRNQKLVLEHTNNNISMLQYFGPQEQKQYLGQLKKQLPHLSSELDFLLGRFQETNFPSYGRSRNWSLVLGAGARVVQLDDDILFQACRHPSSVSELHFTLAPRHADFYHNREELETLYLRETPDPAEGELLSVLGVSVSEILSKYAPNPSSPELLKSMASSEASSMGADSRILVASCGYLGDPGTKSSDWLYLLDSASRKRLTLSRESYDLARTKRNVWIGSNSYNLVARYSLMSGLTGLANNEILPPYFPLFRNEDYLFGNLIKFLHPHSMLMDMPWAIPHIPATHRRWENSHEPRPIRQGIQDFLADYLQPFGQQLTLNSPSERLRALSWRIMELADTPQSDIKNILRQSILALRTQHIRQIQNKIENSPDAPDFWKKDAERLIAVNERGLMGDLNELPTELENIPSPLEFAKTVLKKYSMALAAWEEIRETAAETNTTKDSLDS